MAPTFHDAFAMAHSIKTSVVREHDALRDQEARKKVKYDNPLEASVVTSFETQIPTILASTGKSAHSGMSTSLKTFKDFKRAGRDTGVGREIKDGCKSVYERVNRLLKTQGTNAEACALALGMALDSKLFNEGFVKFMEELNDELTTDTTYSPQEA
jgi:hypothetical protein